MLSISYPYRYRSGLQTLIGHQHLYPLVNIDSSNDSDSALINPIGKFRVQGVDVMKHLLHKTFLCDTITSKLRGFFCP